jgi:hypothetical protein
MKSLKELEGTTIVLLSPFFHATQLQRVMLHKVEDYGVWIESQMLTDKMLGVSKAKMAPKTPVFFLPWHHISVVMSSLDMPAISDDTAL